MGWSFSNEKFSLSDELITTGLPSFVLPKDSIFKSKGFVAGFTVGVFFVICLLVLLALFLIQRKREKERKRMEMEDWELEYWMKNGGIGNFVSQLFELLDHHLGVK